MADDDKNAPTNGSYIGNMTVPVRRLLAYGTAIIVATAYFLNSQYSIETQISKNQETTGKRFLELQQEGVRQNIVVMSKIDKLAEAVAAMGGRINEKVEETTANRFTSQDAYISCLEADIINPSFTCPMRKDAVITLNQWRTDVIPSQRMPWSN